MEYRIIRHKNPNGRVTWHRAVYWDEKGRPHYSPRYTGANSVTKRAAQNWLYANIHIWCKIMHVEQRIIGPDGNRIIIQQGIEEII